MWSRFRVQAWGLISIRSCEVLWRNPPASSCGSARAAARWRWRRRAWCAQALAAAHGFDPERIAHRGDPHQRRPHPGPAAGGGRRQGPVHQGDRGGADAPARSISRCIRRRTCRPCCRRAWCCTAFLEREDPRDVFISRKAKSIAELPRGATVGTASLRRQAMVKRHAARSRHRAAARQCRDAAAQARRGRGRRDVAGAGRTEAARPRRRRDRDARRRRISAGGRAGRHRHRDARRRFADARPAGGDQSRRHRSARWLPSARSSPCSTAPAARRSAATRRSPADGFAFAA